MIKLLLIKGVFTKYGNTAKVICQQGRADGLACLDLSVNVGIQVLDTHRLCSLVDLHCFLIARLEPDSNYTKNNK